MAALIKKRALAEYSQVVQERAQPLKQIRLIKKVVSSAVQLNLQSATNSQEVLHILLKFEESLPIDEDSLSGVLRELFDHFPREKEAMVRCKIAMVIKELAYIPSFKYDLYTDEILSLLKTEKSHRVVSQLVDTLTVVGKSQYHNTEVQEKLLSSVFKLLSDSSHLVRSSCLDFLGKLGTTDCQHSRSHQPLQKILADHMYDIDSRVRRSAFNAVLNLHQRGIQVDLAMYDHCCRSLKDDYEDVRMAAIKLIWVLCHLYPESTVPVTDTCEEIRLVDDGFVKICNSINDFSMKVRKEAASLLGSLHLVSPKFLEQTLDKKLMSNMRRKRTAHERARENYMSGEWSTGKIWADDAPKEALDPDNISLMNSGACGAFVHGLEDEYLEVRNAALDSLCELSVNSPSFARLSQDCIIDMFNDEIESVRLNAINSIRKVSAHLELREDQLDIILGVLQDFSGTIRESLREMLGHMKLATSSCLNNCVMELLENLKRYPQDKVSIWKCMKKLGENVPNLTLSLAPDLLCIQPYFSTPEPDIEDPAYLSILVLVFNAAARIPTLLPMFSEYVWRHYSYLRKSIPDLVAPLSHPSSQFVVESEVSSDATEDMTTFFNQTSARLETLSRLEDSVAQNLLKMTLKDLDHVSKLGTKFSDSAEFMHKFVQCQLMLSQVVSKTIHFFCEMSTSDSLMSSLDKVLLMTEELEKLFLGVGVSELSLVHQTRLKASAVMLTLVLCRCDEAESSQACRNFLQMMQHVQKFLTINDATLDRFLSELFSKLDGVEDVKPVVLHKLVQNDMSLMQPQALHISNRLCKVEVVIHEPTKTSDNPLKFTAGLTAALPLHASINNIQDVSCIRALVKYPDLETQLVKLNFNDFRKLGPLRYNLVTNVILSHRLWSEPCHVEVSLVLCTEPGYQPISSSNKSGLFTLQLSKPVTVLVATKPIKC
ncbi:integrator complex subunit 4-like [Octopus vulgaris]|uniref:Integrator complex subunit 4-like n=1 Tax=Octopus vulgaris TaxID=6645 RepID=A0AA36BWY2_OCTVU|nr:integrator complex subunit 4-like [Octopus vulgaris]